MNTRLLLPAPDCDTVEAVDPVRLSMSYFCWAVEANKKPIRHTHPDGSATISCAGDRSVRFVPVGEGI